MLKDNFPDRFKKARYPAGLTRASVALTPSAALQVRFPGSAGYGVKAVSREGTERLMEAAIDFALTNKSKSVTLVHKGASPARVWMRQRVRSPPLARRQHHEEHGGRLPRLGLQAGAVQVPQPGGDGARELDPGQQGQGRGDDGGGQRQEHRPRLRHDGAGAAKGAA
jgi:hypothetical protein